MHAELSGEAIPAHAGRPADLTCKCRRGELPRCPNFGDQLAHGFTLERATALLEVSTDTEVSLSFWLPLGDHCGMRSGIGGTAHWRGWRQAKASDLPPAAQLPSWWINLATDGAPLRAIARLQPSRSGRVEITALLLERTDGQVLTARDLTGVRLGELQQSAQHTYGWMQDSVTGALLAPTPVAPPPKPGRSRSNEHYRAVWDIWQEAREAAPSRSSAWLRQEWKKRYGEDVAWPTIVRWRDRAIHLYGKYEEGPSRTSATSGWRLSRPDTSSRC